MLLKFFQQVFEFFSSDKDVGFFTINIIGVFCLSADIENFLSSFDVLSACIFKNFSLQASFPLYNIHLLLQLLSVHKVVRIVMCCAFTNTSEMCHGVVFLWHFILME
jgi:hypothetical protein